jgi:hypothetical protein
MTTTGRQAEIARVAQEIWEAEGRPEGRAAEHWRLAEERVARSGDGAGDDTGPRPVQPGFKDAKPGMVPEMKTDPVPELGEDAGGRFAQQVLDTPEGADTKPQSGAKGRKRAPKR